MITLLRSFLFYLGMTLSTVLIAPLVILSFPLSFQHRYSISKLWTRFNIWWLKQTCGLNHKVIGSENLPDKAVVILSKHQSTWETIFLHQYLPPLTWVIKKELVSIPLFGWSLALLQPIAIDRSSAKLAMRQLLEQGEHYLEAGRWVLIFPEGTRTAPGEHRRYHSGGARLAARSGYPVLPIAHNAGIFWPRHGFRKRSGTITIVFGPLIETEGHTPEEINTSAEKWIENTMTEITRLS